MTTAQIVSLIVVAILAILGGFLIIKKAKNDKVLKIGSLVLYAVLLILWIILKDARQTIGLIAVLCSAVLGGYLIITKSKSNSLGKWVLLFICMSIALTWVFEYGNFNGAEYISYGMNEQGLTDIPNFLYYTINFAGDKLVFLLALGAFYAVLSKSNGYKKLVVTIAEKFKGKEIIFAVISSLLFTVMASLFSQTFAALVFVPFVISILLNMKLDKITAFSVTFGSILIGLLGVTYGSEGLYWFNYYAQTNTTNGLVYRLLVLVVAFLLFNFFNILHIKKVVKEKNLNELDADPFKVEKVDNKVKTWPILVTLLVAFVIFILGYIGWETNFKITAFGEFHKWLMGVKLGDTLIFKMLLGTKAAAFGAWDLFPGAIFLIILAIIVALISRVSISEFVASFLEGVKKLAKPILLFLGVYVIMVAAYFSPYIPTIANMMFKNVESFNPYLVSLMAFISNVIHTDLGFTGFVVGGHFVSTYGANVDVIHTIFTTMYGFVGVLSPTSAILLFGLSYLDIDYKTWIKYIWIFVLAILVILLVLFTVMTYI